MAQTIKLRRSAVAGNRPTTAQLDLGELAINTYDGKIYFEKSGSNGETIQEIFTTNTQNSGSLNTIGDVIITGSLSTTGSNTLIGITSLTGALNVSGSETIKGYVQFMPVTTDVDNSVSASYVYVSGSTNDLYFTQNGNGYSNTTRLRWLEGNLYTGLLHGGRITATTGSTTFNVSSGSGIIVSLNASINDDPYPTIKYLNWDNINNISVTNITSSIQSFIGITSTGEVIQQTNAFNDGDYNTFITLGTVLHQNKSTVNATITYPNVAYGYKQRTFDFIKAFGPLKLSGFAIQTSGSLGLTVGSGTAFADGRNYQTDPNSPSYVSDPGTTVSKIFRYYQSGSSFIQDTNNAVGYTEIDPTQYNVDGVLTAVDGNNPNNYYWTLQRVFWYPNSATKGIVVYYGNTQYASETEAIANLAYETFNEVENTKQNAVQLGTIVLRKDANWADNSTYTILPAGVFRNVGGSGGGGSVAPARLQDLQDTYIVSPANGELLVYDTTTSRWRNSTNIQNNLTITGSVNIDGTLTAKEYHTTIVSSSVLYQSGSTKFGNTGDDTHEFTGSVQISGSTIITGSLSLRDSLTVGGTLIATAISGSGAGLTDIGVTEKVWYVSEDGLDTNDGKTLSTSFRTVKAAITAASASLAANPGLPVYRQSVQVKSGYYVEEAPITVPSNVSILGDDLRSVVIRPTSGTKGENLFLMNNGTYCWGLRLEGCEIDDLDDPRQGFFFAFAPNAYIVTSPYVQNCSAIHTPSDKFYTPLDYENNNPLIGNGPGGMIVDDSVLHPYSPLKSMIVDAYTQVAFNGIGICIRGRGYGQLVSFFTNFSSTGVFCIDGGHASLLNSNTTFGDYGLRAIGKRMLVRPDISAVSASIDVSGSLLLKAEKTNIQNYMINKLVLSGSYNSTYVSGSGSRYASTITDSGLLIDALADDLLQVKPTRTSQFTSGLFKGQDISTGSLYTLPPAISSSFDKGAITVFPLISNTSGSLAGDFILSYGYMKEYVLQDPDSRFTTMTTAAKNKIGQMFDVVSDTLTQVVVQNSGSNLLEEFGSLVTSTSHDFSYAGAGVNFLALPINQGGIGETNYDIRISEISGGRVFHTSGDETGDFYAGNDFVIRQATGTIEGRTFTKALSAQFTPLNLALEN
jgi:hypothetical protein